MATINEIVIRGCKSQNNNQPLTGKDIFIGPNGIGKTTRLQALGISLLGYCPGEGKLPTETFKLATSDQMSVGLKLDNFQFSRTFKRSQKRNKDGSTDVTVSQCVEVSPSRGEKTLKQKEGRIMAECGSFPVMLDFNEFLGLSDAKRRDFIYSLSPITTSAWDRDKVEKYIRERLLTMELEVNNPDQYQVMSEMIAEAMVQFPKDYDVQAGIQSMLDWAKTKQSHWNAEKKNAEGAVKKLADLKNELAQTDRNIAQNKEQLEALQVRLSEVEQQIARDTEKKKAIDKRFKRIDELQVKITDIDTELAKPVDDKEFEVKIEQQNLLIKYIDITEKVNKLHEEQQQLEEQKEQLSKDQNEKYKVAVEAEGEVRVLNAALKRIKEQKGVCVISPLVSCNKDFGKYAEWANTEISKHRSAIQKNQAEMTRLGQEVEKLTARIKAISQSIRDLNNQVIEQQKVNETARKAIAAINQQKADLSNQRERFNDQLKLYREELQNLKNEPVEAIAPIDALEKSRDGLKVQISDLKAKTQEQERAKNTLSNLKSSMIDSKKAAYYADCSKYLAEALGPKGLQGELVREILDPIRENIQANLTAMGIEKQFYFQLDSDTGKEIFQFGWINNENRKVNFDALSTGQKLILLVALMVTLLDRANPPLKVLAIDNIENLDRDNFRRVISGLDKLEGKLDNIILAGVIEALDIEGWQVWDLGSGNMEVAESAIA